VILAAEWWIYVLAGVVGVVAGGINTLAGSGSLLTLPMLVFLGLPADVANGTNRVGIAFQSLVGLATLRRAGRLQLGKREFKLLIPTLIGSAIGATIAIQMGEWVMRVVIGVVMAASLVVVLGKPARFVEGAQEAKPLTWLVFIAFIGIGFYGGFIQASVGVLLLIGLVAGAGYDVVTANGIKLFLTFTYTLVALPIFALNGQVDWMMGGLMAIGQGVGAWGAARFSVQNEHAGLWIQRLIVLVIVASVIKLFFF